nr:ATP-binding cassette domain-containing protein [Lachnospiraceae bacterium]
MIRFENVSFHYGGDRGTGEGVDNINLEIKDGEVVVLCGASGCGKTTITRLINGLAPHFYQGELEGSVWIDETNVSKAELSETSKLVGSVFQNPKSQFFNVDTSSELVFGCENQGMTKEEMHKRVEKTKEDLKLDALLGRNIFELSGGEKQQVACGSVYTAAPKVYVLDEPSSNLDRKAIIRLRDMLRKVKEAGATIVISEHRLYYLMDLADRFIYVDDGIIQESYSAKELRKLSAKELSAKGLRLTDLGMLEKNPEIGVIEQAGEIAIEAIDLNCVRGNQQILDIERMSLPKNSIIAVIGDNGCGKSTFTEALCGIGVSDGSIAFGGKYLTPKERSNKSFMVMQDVNRQLFSDSVIDEVTLKTDVSKEEAEKLLTELGLGDTLERHPSSLSGGQKQRVAIASALLAGKEIIFYDEPTSGLDRRGMERFGRLLNEMKDKVTSVIITHDPELILSCCTHILHLENGRVMGFYPLNEEGTSRVRSYFTSTNDDNTSKRRVKLGMFGKVLQYAGKWKKYIYVAALLMIVGALCSVVPYAGVYRILDKLFTGEKLTLEGLLPEIGMIVGFGVLFAITYTAGLQFSHRAAYHTLENIRISLQEKLENQPLGNVHAMGTGAVKKLFNDDVESIEIILAHIIPQGFSNLFVSAVILLVLIAVDWQMALLTLIVIGFGFAASKQMMVVGMDRMGNHFAAAKRLNNKIIEYVSGMEVVRVFNRDAQSGKNFEESVHNYRDYALDWFRVCWPWMALYDGLFANITLYSLPFGAFMVISGYLTLSRYVLALCLSFAIAPLLMSTLGLVGNIPRVNYKIQAIEKALDREPLKCGDKKFEGNNHTIDFEDVHFSYKSDEVLKGVSFTAKEGEMTALVGESGSGKSTLAKLLAHYYDVSSGKISIGGQNIRELSLEELGKQVAFVSQDLFLFNKSILENIRVGRPDATDEEVKEAARAAQC